MAPGTTRKFSLEYFWNRLASDDNGTSKDVRVSIKTKIAPTAITSGRKTVASGGSALALVAVSTPCYKVEVCADLANTNPVVVGGSGVVAALDAQEGSVLTPGNPPLIIEIDDVAKLYVDAISDGDSVCFNYYTY